ncbi:MAG: SRPBCC domain-containing protein [Candidatus Saccharimonadia bacterium]
MKTIVQNYEISATIDQVWEALVSPSKIEEWGGGPSVEMQATKGSEFKLWGGDIYGTNTKVEAPKLLEQDWNTDGFDKPSKVTFALSAKNGVTHLLLTHSNVPDDREQDISEGWKEYYLGPMKQLLEA